MWERSLREIALAAPRKHQVIAPRPVNALRREIRAAPGTARAFQDVGAVVRAPDAHGRCGSSAAASSARRGTPPTRNSSRPEASSASVVGVVCTRSGVDHSG